VPLAAAAEAFFGGRPLRFGSEGVVAFPALPGVLLLSPPRDFLGSRPRWPGVRTGVPPVADGPGPVAVVVAVRIYGSINVKIVN